jgi:hypothetical protein
MDYVMRELCFGTGSGSASAVEARSTTMMPMLALIRPYPCLPLWTPRVSFAALIASMAFVQVSLNLVLASSSVGVSP